MTFETIFFGPGNRLRWEAIQAGSLADDVKTRLAPFIDDLKRNPEVLILPRVRDDGRIQWYVMCSSPRAARVARDEVRAFLGPTYSDFEGRPAHLDSADGVEAAVLARSGRNAFRLEVPDGALVNAARVRLRLLMRLRDERPARHGRRTRVTGRILRDFEYALLTRDGTGASDCIAELRSGGHLGATNLLFLEVRRLEATGQWRAILALPELEALVAVARPRRVTEALIRAVYEGLLREFEEGARSAEAIEVFRSAVLPRFRSLYGSRAGLSGYEIDASFLMLAAASPVPRPELASAILTAYGQGSSGRPYLVALADLIPGAVTRPEEKTLSEARAAFATADIDRAYELALSLSPSFDRCALLLRCARDMGTLAAAQVALAAVEALALSDRSRLDGHAVLGRIRDGLAVLATETAAAPSPPLGVGEEIPTSWAAWLMRLTLQIPWSAAVSVAEAGAREWSVEAVATDGAAVEAMANLLLSDRPEWGQSALRDALPHFLAFLLSRGPDPRLRVVYDALFLLLAVDDQVSLPQVAALLRVTEARIQIGVGTGEYRDILRELSSAIDAVESPTVATLALEALDTLVGVACPDARQRQEFLVRVAALFQRWYRRMDQAQWALLRRYAEEVGVSDVIQAGDPEQGGPPAESVWEALEGKRIALYSLREAALRRVESVVHELCQGARIETFHDSVGGSPALRAASATADVFVLATAAAKHAATIFIEANRPKARVTIYARGQGSASLLDAIREYLVSSTAGRRAASGIV